MAVNADTSLVLMTTAVANPKAVEASTPLHLALKALKAAGLVTFTEGSAAPSGGVENDLYFKYDSGLNAGTAPAGDGELFRHNGAAWTTMAPAQLAGYLSSLNFVVNAAQPANQAPGGYWYDTTSLTLKVCYSNGSSKSYAPIGSTLYKGMVLSAAEATPPGGPSAGDQYIVPTGATGAWAGQTNNIVTWTGTAWAVATPSKGSLVVVADSDAGLYWDGLAWTSIRPVTAPGAVPAGLPVRTLQFTANGTYTPTDNNVRAVKVTVVGAGGGGGGVDGQGAGTAAVGSGGGGGAIAEKTIIIANPATYAAALTLGVGGAGGDGATAANGGNGTASVYNDTGGGGTDTLRAGGGFGGAGDTGGSGYGSKPGGAGGTATGGSYNRTGETANAGNRAAGAPTAFSYGGGGPYGTPGIARSNSAVTPASGYGTGGAASATTNENTNYTGGAGMPGLIIVEEFE